MLPQTEARPSLKTAVRSAIRNAFHPKEFLHAFKLQKLRKSRSLDRVRRDPQLELYSRILKRGFLHYGYFKDPQTAPEALSFRDIEEAQLEYAKLFSQALTPSDRLLPILDIGCGMGGLSVLLSEQGYQPVALSPDQHQISYIQEKHPKIPTLHCKLEELELEQNRGRFGAIITSESLQYLNLDVALPIFESILAPGGKWLLCDYFRKDERAHEKSGHVFETFKKRVESQGWVIHQDIDVTPNILVTLRYLQFLADRLVLPLMDFGVGKLQHKQPGWAYLLRDVLGEVKRSTLHGLQTVDPERFAQEKTYRWMELRRK